MNKAAEQMPEGKQIGAFFDFDKTLSDIPMLACVGNPAAVEPTRLLREKALEEKWSILTFR